MTRIAVCICWLAILATVPGLSPAAERPDIVLILADDLGYSDLGCYGGEIATPNLDRLAQAGLRFTQAYNTSKCFPSRACLLTGAYAQQVGMDRSPGAIRNGLTLAQVLKAAGYRTLMTGKHHGTQNPHDLGFDRYFGLRDGACNYFNPGHPRPDEPAPAQKRPGKRFWCIDEKTLQPFTPDDPKFYTTDAFTDHALSYLEEYGKEEQPFFLYVAYNAPHDPLQAWPKDIARYAGRYDAGWKAVRNARHERQKTLELFGGSAPLSPLDIQGDWSALTEEKRQEEARRMEVYAAMIDCMDRNIGRVVGKLEALHKLDDTVIIFASDNGASAEVVKIGSGPIGSMTRWASLQKRWANVSNTPFRKYKNHSYEGGICTPLIVHWPRKVGESGGGFVRTPVHVVDLMATFLELSGGTYPGDQSGEALAPLQGTSLVPTFSGQAIARSQPLFWQWGQGKAIREGRWKLVSHGRQTSWELYDVVKDRAELEDLSSKHPDRVSQMAAKWVEWRKIARSHR